MNRKRQRWSLLIALSIALPMQAAVRTPVSQSGPYSWTTGTYHYDAAGNVTAIGSYVYTYDPLSRIAASHMSTPDSVSDQTFTYDAAGNLTQQTNAGIPTLMPVDVATNHLDPAIAAYDDAGHVSRYQPPASGHTYGFRYDALDVVSEETADNVPAAWFIYTADDERLRIERPTAGTKHWRIRNLQKSVVRDVQLSGTTLTVYRDYLYRGTSLLAAVTPSTTEHFTLDHLNSPRLLTDVVGNRIAEHTYLPFGQELGAGAADGEPLKFTGHERDDDPAGGTNPLDYMHARYYAANLARFMAVDPVLDLLPTLSEPQRWNRYTYAIDNPIRYTDPDGRAVTIIITRNTYTDKSIISTINVTSDVKDAGSFSGYTLETTTAGANGDKDPIPAGTYDASVRTDHDPHRVELQDVPGFSNIQIHVGNSPSDVQGCFAVGKTSGTDQVNQSRDAMKEVLSVIDNDKSGVIKVTVSGDNKKPKSEDKDDNKKDE